MADRAAIAELVALGRRAGHDVLLVQGGGGNISAKSADGTALYIKASGVRIADVTSEHGWLAVDLSQARLDLADPALAVLDADSAHEAAMARLASAGGRPSMEIHFHAALGPAVLHLHPVRANVFACAADGAARLAEALGARAAWVPYVTPGFHLGRAVVAAVERQAASTGVVPDIVVLQNHGAIAHGPTATAAIAAMDTLLAAGSTLAGPLPAGWDDVDVPSAAAQAWAAGLGSCARATRRPWLAALAAAAAPWPAAGPLLPDDVVYGAEPPAQTLAGLAGAVRGPLGLALVGPDAAFVDAMEEMLLAQALVATLVARFGQVTTLPGDEPARLRAMNAEKHRLAVTAARGTP